MTAVCGAVFWRSGPEPDLLAVLANLAPYGDVATWTGDSDDMRISLAAVRRRPQPDGLVVGGERVVVCADARLHHRGDLARLVDRTVSDSDVELLLAAYRRWGQRCVEHLYGSFAFAIADLERRGVFLATDHVGSRPLAYYAAPGAFAFSSTALSLTGFAGVGHQLDADRAVEVLLLADGTDRSFVQGVRTVPPGEAMWIDASGPRRWRWWMPSEPDIVDHGSLAEQGRRLRVHLESAVSSCVADSGHVGAMLSGGLDSTSVAVVAASQIAPQPLRTFTGVPPRGWTGTTSRGWISDERTAVEALARKVPNLLPCYVETEYGSLYDGHTDLWELGAGPARNGFHLPWLYDVWGGAQRAGVNVMLTGSMGNLGYSADGPRWLAELFTRGRWLRTMREARSFGRAFEMPLKRVLRRHLAGELAAPIRHRAALRRGDVFRTPPSWSAINSSLWETLDLESILSEEAAPHSGGYLRDVHNLFRTYAAHADTTLAVNARFGFELRDPTEDRRLIEHTLTQPEWYRRHDGVWRAIARESMRDLLPPEIVHRQTLGAQQPDWFDRMTFRRDEIAGEIEAMRAHHLSTEVIDVERLGSMVDSWPARDQMADPAIVESYQLALGRAIFVSRYLRWFEDRARRVKNGGPAVIVNGLS